VRDADFDLIRRAWEAQSERDEDRFRALLHPEVVVQPFGSELERESYHGRDEVIRWWQREVVANWDVYETIPEDFRRVGNRILVTGRWHAVLRRSGVELEMPAAWVMEIRDGKVGFWRTYTDPLRAMREA
jgi:ketosteroid isomerase-like protein